MTEPNFHLRASEWKTSDQQRLEILMKVKNNEISQEEAVRLIEEMETNLQHLNTDTNPSRSRSGSDASLSSSSKSNSPGFLKKFRISTKGSKHKSKQEKQQQQQQQQERRLSSASGSSTSSRRSTFSFHFRRGGNKKQSRTSSQTSFSTSSVDLSPAPSGEDIHTCDSPDISNYVDHDRIESNPQPQSTPVNPFTADSSDTDDEDEPVPTVVLDPDTTPGSPIDDTPIDTIQTNEEAQGDNSTSFKAIVTQTPRLTIYDTKSLKVNEGDEVIVLDDSHPNEWLCQHNGQQGLIKFVYLQPLDT